MDRLLKNMN